MNIGKNIKQQIKLKTYLFAFIMLAGCVGQSYAKLSDSDTNALKQEGNLKRVKLTWQKRNTDQLSERVAHLASISGMLDVNSKSLIERMSENGAGNWLSVDETNPAVIVKVIPDYDEIRIVNSKLSDNIEGKDVGKERAVNQAVEFLSKLQDNKLLNGLKYNPEQMKVGYHILGQGSLDGSVEKKSVAEYRITFLANIDNIPLANAGVRVSVHRSGQISGIRLGGVTVEEVEETGIARQSSDEKIKQYFRTTIPEQLKPRVAWERVMYVMPDDKTSAVVEPTYTISYSLVSTSKLGGEVVSRRQTVGFSLMDQELRIIDFMKPAEKHQSIKLTRDASADEKRHIKIQDAEKHSH